MSIKANKFIKKIEKLEKQMNRHLTGKDCYDIGLITMYTRDINALEEQIIKDCSDDDIADIREKLSVLYKIVNDAINVTNKYIKNKH